MTSCADIRENISAYADNELGIEERQAFEEHISRCPSCREELEDMLRIIAALKSLPMQELPEGFGDELHEKLLAVSSGRTNIHVIREKPKKPAFARTIASIAAGILLIFLGGGIVRFGLLSGNLAPKNDGNIDMTASSPETAAVLNDDSVSFNLKAAPDTDTAGIMSQGAAPDAGTGILSMEDGIAENDMLKEIPSKSFAADRSLAERDNAAYGITALETVVVRSSTVTILAENTEEALGEIVRLANAYNGALQETDGIPGSLTNSTDNASFSVSNERSEVRRRMRYVFGEEDYGSFVAALSEAFGAADVQTGAFVSVDMTDSINMLINQSEAYDAEIQKLQTDNSSDSSDEIGRLKKEKEIVDDQIERIRLDSDFIAITVYINPK